MLAGKIEEEEEEENNKIYKKRKGKKTVGKKSNGWEALSTTPRPTLLIFLAIARKITRIKAYFVTSIMIEKIPRNAAKCIKPC